MGRSKKHHYVPQYLLRNFLTDNSTKIEVFDKQTREYRRQAVREIAHENHYNRINHFDGRFDGESISQKLDDKHSKLIKRIISDRSLGICATSNRREIAEFAAYQYSRIPLSRRNLAEAFSHAAKMANTMPEGESRDSMVSELESVDLQSEHAVASFKNLGGYTDVLTAKLFTLCEPFAEEFFWISDCPISVRRWDGLFHMGGLGTPWTEICIPISSTLCFRIMSLDFLACMSSKPDWVRSIGRGLPFTASDNDLEYLRVSQVGWSSRFVYAPEFDRDYMQYLEKKHPAIFEVVEDPVIVVPDRAGGPMEVSTPGAMLTP